MIPVFGQGDSLIKISVGSSASGTSLDQRTREQQSSPLFEQSQ